MPEDFGAIIEDLAAMPPAEIEALIEFRATFHAFTRKEYGRAKQVLARIFEQTIHYAFQQNPKLEWGRLRIHPLARVAEIAELADTKADANGETEITPQVLTESADEVICAWRVKCRTRYYRAARFRIVTVFCEGYAANCPQGDGKSGGAAPEGKRAPRPRTSRASK